MGRHSDSEQEYSSRKLKKKKKKRSRTRSRSRSSNDSRYSHSHAKHKKSKKKHRHRSKSRSLSSDRYSRRDRSPARRRRSRSRSYERSRRSRSYEKSRYSRSPSRGRRSRSSSRDRYRRSKRSVSKERSRRSRSGSGSWSRSRRSSSERRKGRQSVSPTHSLSTSFSESNLMDDIPGFSEMTPAEQAQLRLKMALRAAAAADEKLKENSGASPSQRPASPLSRQQFADAVAGIEADSFAPAAFKSSRSNKAKDVRDSNDLSFLPLGTFGAVGSSVVFTKTEAVDKNLSALEDDPSTLFDQRLDEDPDEKMKRWIEKLTYLRMKKLEGEAIIY